MLLILRKTLFFLLLVLYLFITPYVVLYALGYMIKPVEGELYKTGIISVVTEPHDANLYIEGRKYSHKTPATLRDLLPGRYPVRITRKGYDSWEKEVRVVAEKATRLDPVLLLPVRASEETFSQRSYTDLLPVGSEFKIYGLEGKTLSGLWKTDLLFKKEAPVLLKPMSSVSPEIVRLRGKKNSDLVLFELGETGAGKYALVDPGRDTVTDLSTWMAREPQWIDWDAKNPGQAYFLDAGEIRGIDLKEGGPTVVLQKDVLGFGAEHNRLYLLKKDFSFIETNRRGENPEPLLVKEAGALAEMFKNSGAQYYRIEVLKRDLFQKDFFLFLGDQGDLYINSFPDSPVYKDVLGDDAAEHEEKILFWTKGAVGVVRYGVYSDEVVGESAAKRILFNRGRNIRQAFWIYEDSHILFVDGDAVYLLETLQPPYGVRKITDIASESSVVYNDRNHVLYYLDNAGRHLNKRKITD